MGMKRVWGRGAVALLLSTVAVACVNSTAPEERPTSAHIQVEGTAPGPLRLIVSTDFYQVQDAVTFEVREIVEVADTTLIDLPYEGTVDLGVGGSVLVDVANPDSVPANVRMRVDLDTGQASYDRSATMSEGGALRYVYLFLQVIV